MQLKLSKTPNRTTQHFTCSGFFKMGNRAGKTAALIVMLAIIPRLGIGQQSANPTDIKSALGISGESISPVAEKSENAAPKVAHSKVVNTQSSGGWREKWLKKWRDEHERKAAKKMPEQSAAPHVAHPTRGTHADSPLTETKQRTAKNSKLNSSKSIISHAGKSHKESTRIEHSQKHVALHKPKSSKPSHVLINTNGTDPHSKHDAVHKSQKIKLNTQLMTANIDNKSLPDTKHLINKAPSTAHIRPLITKKAVSPDTQQMETSPRSPVIKSVSASVTPPTSIYGQTKPDGFTETAESSKDHTQNSPIGAVNDSGRLMLFLIPTLAVLVGVLQLIRKYLEKNGHIGRPSVQNGMGRNRLAQWNFPQEKKTGIFKTIFSGMFKTPSSVRTGDIHVIESIPLGNTHLHLVEVRGRTLLLGANSSGVNLLTELEENEIDEIQGSFHAQLHAATADLSTLDLSDTETPLQSMVATLEDVMRETREAVAGRARRLHTVREDEEFIV